VSHGAPSSSVCQPFPLKLARRSLNGALCSVSAMTRCSPRSTRVRSVTRYRAASRRASRNSESEISTVVFMFP